MEHPGEFWQEYDCCGRRIMDGHGVNPGDQVPNYFAGVAIMLYRYRDGEVEFLFQHRAKELRGNPDKWDVSAGGHVNYDEPKLQTAVRETSEEIGVEINPEELEFAASYLITTNNGIAFLYFYDWQERPDDFKFNDHEVQEVKWVKAKDLVVFSENFKPQLKNDQMFFVMLSRWEAKIRQKYGNN